MGARATAALPLSVRLSVPARGVDLELEVAAGELVVVLGPNGAGKSTLLRAVAGLLEPGPADDVRVALGGRVLTGTADGVHVPPRARHVGWLAQRAALLDHVPALDNVAFGPASRIRWSPGRAARTREVAAAHLAAVSGSSLAARRPRELSGGQAQRVAIARALATSPDVLLMDEPSAALDVDNAAQVRSLIRAMHQAQPRTTLLVTHDPADVRVADRVVVLDRGRIVEDGPAAQVLASPESAFARRLLRP
nr:ATP-binding cassette domain-containing protein [Antribacter gilvus]